MLKKDKKLRKVVNPTVSGAALEIINELDKNDVALEGAIVNINKKTGRAKSIKSIRIKV